LEHTQAGFDDLDLAHDDGAGMGKARIEAAAARPLHGFERSYFERKAADIIGLYVNSPAHAAVFCVDEKTAIPALDPQGPGVAIVAGPGADNTASSIKWRYRDLTPRITLNAVITAHSFARCRRTNWSLASKRLF
jgi:hypothetical protein